MGSLTDLEALNLSENQLTGNIPSELGSLNNLQNLDLRYNALYTDDDDLRTFLNNKQDGGDWENTQTVRPSDLAAVTSVTASPGKSLTRLESSCLKCSMIWKNGR